MQTLTIKLESVLQTLWIGGMWIIGYVVAPILFATLDDTRLAGKLAGYMFIAIYYIGLVCGSLLLILCWKHSAGVIARNYRFFALVIMLLLVLVAVFVILPIMHELKQVGLAPGSEAEAQFTLMHQVSSALYLVTSLLGLFVIIARRKTD